MKALKDFQDNWNTAYLKAVKDFQDNIHHPSRDLAR